MISMAFWRKETCMVYLVREFWDSWISGSSKGGVTFRDTSGRPIMYFPVWLQCQCRLVPFPAWHAALALFAHVLRP